MYLGELPTLIQSFAYFDQRWGLVIVASPIVLCVDSKENKAKIQYNAISFYQVFCEKEITWYHNKEECF